MDQHSGLLYGGFGSKIFNSSSVMVGYSEPNKKLKKEIVLFSTYIFIYNCVVILVYSNYYIG